MTVTSIGQLHQNHTEHYSDRYSRDLEKKVEYLEAQKLMLVAQVRDLEIKNQRLIRHIQGVNDVFSRPLNFCEGMAYTILGFSLVALASYCVNSP